MEKIVLAVDGGGTKTVSWLARVRPEDGPQILGRGAAGSSNLQAVGSENALANLSFAIKSSWIDAGLQPAAADVAVFALAGSGQVEAQAQVLDWAMRQAIAKKVQVLHDARAVLLAGTPAGWGVALVAGTGAVAFALDATGKQAVAGGWGHWFGDEGSAFWLGQFALRTATQAVDGRGSSSRLTQAILDRLEITEPKEMLSALSRGGDVRQAIAALADLVSLLAAEEDEVAARIVDEAVAHLAGLVVCVANQLSIGKQFPLALAGGVLCGSSFVRERLTTELRNHDICPSSLQLVHEPVHGCLRHACREAAAD